MFFFKKNYFRYTKYQNLIDNLEEIKYGQKENKIFITQFVKSI